MTLSVRKRSSSHNQLRQSPINIMTSSVVFDPEKCLALHIKFTPGDCSDVDVDADGTWHVHAKLKNTSTVQGSQLPGNYRLLQFHAHWGGSEHTVDGKRFDGELHFVYWNTKYKSPEDATGKGDGLAVLGVLIQEGARNETFSHLLHTIMKSAAAKKAAKLSHTFDPVHLLPRNGEGIHRYFTYLGSLTTPPYTECVVWTILQTPITLSHHQLETLQKLTPANYRQCQKLCARKVYVPRY